MSTNKAISWDLFDDSLYNFANGCKCDRKFPLKYCEICINRFIFIKLTLKK